MVSADAIEEVAIRAVRKVMNYLRSGEREHRVIGEGPSGDKTRVFDAVAERIIIEELLTSFNRDLLVVSEEMGVREFGSGELVAIIDPVDGSTNYMAGIPWVGVSLGIARRKGSSVPRVGDIIVGVVGEVFRDAVYVFREGYVKVNRERVVRRGEPPEVLLGYFGSPEAYRPVLRYWELRGGKTALRSLGSASLDILYVGLGRAEGFIDVKSKLRNLDVAAAVRIAEALGASIRLCNGRDPITLRIDTVSRVGCIVAGYNESYLRLLLKSIGAR